MENLEKYDSEMSRKRDRKYNKYQSKTRYCKYHKTSKDHYYLNNDIDNVIFLNSRNDYNKEYSICKMALKDKTTKEKLKSNINKKQLYNNNDSFMHKSKKQKEKCQIDENCPICLDSMIGKVIKTLGCSHKMCIGCFENYQSLKEEDILSYVEIPELEINFMMPSIDIDMYIKYDLERKRINYTVKCPLCRKSIYNNNDSIV